MKTYKKITTLTDEFTSIICDVCKREDTNPMEIQEYINVHFIGGYNSIFEDSGEYACDICQHCVGELLGKHLRYLGSRI